MNGSKMSAIFMDCIALTKLCWPPLKELCARTVTQVPHLLSVGKTELKSNRWRFVSCGSLPQSSQASGSTDARRFEIGDIEKE
jgi:hypothetical protein